MKWAVSSAIRCLSLFILLVVWGPRVAASASVSGTALEYQVKASYIYNFLQFVSFSPEVMAGKSAISVCIVGENRFGEALDKLKGKRTPQGVIEVRYLGHYSPALPFSTCHVLYIVKDEAPNGSKIFEHLQNASTLTIGDYSSFLKQGGVIELFVEDERIHFRINLERAKQASYQIAAQLVALGATNE